ncbi:hypothetical protein J4401_01120, partial [Candidatus Woesearchaeota archaeon]|nr:hypothetical protein [Candidatus Woesearchaeota archaeon]
AEKALEKEEYEKAAGYVDGAINACRDTITSLKGSSLLSKEKGSMFVSILVLIIAILAIWLGMEMWQKMPKKRKK